MAGKINNIEYHNIKFFWLWYSDKGALPRQLLWMYLKSIFVMCALYSIIIVCPVCGVLKLFYPELLYNGTIMICSLFLFSTSPLTGLWIWGREVFGMSKMAADLHYDNIHSEVK